MVVDIKRLKKIKSIKTIDTSERKKSLFTKRRKRLSKRFNSRTYY